MSRIPVYPLTKEIDGENYIEERKVIDMAIDYCRQLDRIENKYNKLKTENEYLKKQIKEMEDFQKVRCASENEIDKDSLITKLQDQHQQDYIRINDLTTTIHVLSGLYSNLRKTVGMD